MKRIAVVVWLTILVAASAEAASDVSNGTSNVKSGTSHFGSSFGINLGLANNGVVGAQAEFDISPWFNKAPVAFQVIWKEYAKPYTVPAGTFNYKYVGIGVAAIYDFSSLVSLGDKIKPYAGLGLVDLSSDVSGPPPVTAPDSGGLYFTGGIRYALTRTLSADVSYNNLGGLTVGAILNF